MRSHLVPSSPRSRRASGQALIVVLLVLVFLTSLMGTITVGMLTESRLTGYQARYLQAYYAARAGLEVAANQILNDSPDYDSLSDRWHRSDRDYAQVPVGNGVYRVFYVDGSTGNERTGVVDEERKLNVNKAEPAMLRRLNPAFTDEIVKAIVARRRTMPFVTVEELATLPEIEPGFLAKPREGAPAGLINLLTVYGDGRINVNTASAAVLASLEGLSAAQVEKLVARREADAQPFRNLDEVRTALGLSEDAFAKVRPRLKVSSSYFTIRSRGWLADERNVVRELREVVRRQDDGLVVVRFEQLR